MKKGILLALLLVMAFSASAFALAPIKLEDQKPVFIYVGPVADGGYNYMHDLGRQAMEKANPGVKGSIVESVPEGPDAERVMETAIRNGAKVVYANSFGYMDHVINVAKKYPDVYFNHCSGYKVAPNVSTYFGRMYQPRYLSGIVAGKATKSNLIGDKTDVTDEDSRFEIENMPSEIHSIVITDKDGSSQTGAFLT